MFDPNTEDNFMSGPDFLITFDMKEIPKHLYESNYECKITARVENTIFKTQTAGLFQSNIIIKMFAPNSLIYNNLTASGSFRLFFQVSIETSKKVFSEKVFHNYRRSEKVIQNFKNMFLDKTFADFTFVVKGTEFKVHKNILAGISTKMNDIFKSDMRSSKTSRCEIVGFEAEDFEKLLRFIYTGKIPENFVDSCMSLYRIAHYFNVGDLVHMCVEEIEANLNILTAVQIHKLAYQYELKDLRLKAWNIIK